MKRGLLVIASAVVIAAAITYGIRHAEHRASSSIAALLPRTTIGFVHIPDFNHAMDEWRRSDIYQIYLEPAVQDFLQKPLSRSPKTNAVSDKIRELQDLETRDGFIALTSASNDKPKFVGGFHFRCSQQVADRVIGGWKNRINPAANREHVVYEKHDIELFTQSVFSLAITQDHSWFFASNDVEELKAVLDRADGRMKDPGASLKGDESFGDAMGAMPTSYAALLYFQPKTFSERLNALRNSTGQAAPSQQALLAQIRSVCATTRFDHGKLHDVVFVGMPKQDSNTELSRGSIALASNAAIFYAVSLVDFSKQVGVLFPAGPNNPLGPAAQKITDALAAAGISANDWEAAFGSELGVTSEWPEQKRWPSLFVATQVKDPVRGRKIIDALTQGFGQDEHWEQSDRDGVHFWKLASASSWLAIRPVMALSDHVWVTALDEGTVENVLRRAQKPEPGLGDTDNYRASTRLVPTPTKFFAYADPAAIYVRLDATVRPVLMMGAAFVPGANDFVDLTKFPPPETITKHLSPIVSSQYYSGKGYVAESVGPLTMNQAGIGLVALGGAGAMAYQRLIPGGLGGLLPTLGGGAGSRGGAAALGPASGSATPTPQPLRTP